MVWYGMVWCGAVLYRVYVHRIAEIKEGMQAMVSFGLYTRHLNSKLYMARKMGSGIVAESGAMVDWSAAESPHPPSRLLAKRVSFSVLLLFPFPFLLV